MQKRSTNINIAHQPELYDKTVNLASSTDITAVVASSHKASKHKTVRLSPSIQLLTEKFDCFGKATYSNTARDDEIGLEISEKPLEMKREMAGIGWLARTLSPSFAASTTQE
ncbi:hypothetical protein HPP92_027012 [Vanilla planifolia]|uniref:Uncharacterized protein n=1 Tax=Vanilla planifolia TaxID=51239 RepID=A0A835QB25_VANPL|nr:hypothetical protein HPP92_027012 [Vanilla planifolia]KAG0469835.1 hypothetical protein HPP92_016535 [Vanilla planifolia]